MCICASTLVGAEYCIYCIYQHNIIITLVLALWLLVIINRFGMCSYFIILNLLLPLGKEKTCKQIIKRQHDYCYNRDINKMLEKLRKWKHSFCLEGLRKDFLKQQWLNWILRRCAIQTTRMREVLRGFVILELPRT